MSLWPTTSRMALSATSFTVPSGFWMLNRIVRRVLDPPEHDEVDIDDVLVAGQHQAFLGHVADVLEESRLSEEPRMPISMRLTRVTLGSSTSSIG